MDKMHQCFVMGPKNQEFPKIDVKNSATINLSTTLDWHGIATPINDT